MGGISFKHKNHYEVKPIEVNRRNVNVAAKETKCFISSILKGKSSIYSEDEHGRTAFFIAVQHGWIDVIKRLLAKDENLLNHPFKSDGNLLSAACVAVTYSQYVVLQYLIARGADLNIGNPSILFFASVNPDKKFLKLIIESGAHINTQDDMFIGSTLLNNFACKLNFDDDALNLLLDNGADLVATGKSGLTAFHLAIKTDCHESLEILTKRLTHHELQMLKSLPYDPEREYEFVSSKQWDQDYGNIFNFAVTYGSLKCVKILLSIMDDDEKSRICGFINPKCLLHQTMASYRHHNDLEKRLQTINILVENGVDINKCAVKLDSQSYNMLQLYFWNHRVQNIKLYFLHCDYSLLGQAIVNAQHEFVSLLLEHGAEVNPSDNIVHPLAVALILKRHKTVKILLSNGANPNYLSKMELLFDSSLVLRPVLLIISCFYADEFLLELLKSGADLNLLPEQFWVVMKQRNSHKYECFQLLNQIFSGYTLNNSLINNQLQQNDFQFSLEKQGLMTTGSGFTSLKHLCRVSVVKQILKANNYSVYKACIAPLEMEISLKLYLEYEN